MENIKSVVKSVVVLGGERNMAVVSEGNDMKLFLNILVNRVGVIESKPINSRGMGKLDDEDLNA